MERRVAVAYSGGRDSTALLHATLAQAAEQRVQVVALHIHHGLSLNADAWLAHCEAQCLRWARRGWPLEFVSRRLSDRPAAGESTEAWARTARYAALAELARAHRADIVLLAHHRRDQAETLLLQALRGAGTKGLAGMPMRAERDGIVWLRPWLDHADEEIAAYVRAHRLRHIVDDSNADPRYARNRLRLQVWPVLSSAFPQAEATLATAATWAQEADAALTELARDDLRGCVEAQGGLRVHDWMALSQARQGNALRAWLKSQLGVAAPATLIARLRAELPVSRQARWPLAAPDQGHGLELRVYRGVLRCEPVVRASLRAELTRPTLDEPESRLSVVDVGTCPLPRWGGAIEVVTVKEEGIPLAWLAHLELRTRRGGERFQTGIGRPPRGLKKQYQAAGVPQWARGGPLVYSGGQLVFVPGLGLDARVLGLPGQPLVTLRWVPSSTTTASASG